MERGLKNQAEMLHCPMRDKRDTMIGGFPRGGVDPIIQVTDDRAPVSHRCAPGRDHTLSSLVAMKIGSFMSALRVMAILTVGKRVALFR